VHCVHRFGGVTCLQVVSSECSLSEAMKRFMNALVSLALLVGPLAAGATETPPTDVPPDARNAALPGLIRVAEKGVFFIRVKDSSGKLISMGTGFLTNKTGAVLTSLHVIRPTTGCAVSAEAIAVNGKACAVKGVTVGDESLDLAVLQLADVAEDAVPIALAGNELPQRGTYVLVLGHPQEFRFVSTDGIVSAVNKTSELPASFRESGCIHSGPDGVWLQASFNRDRLEVGVLEASADDTTWAKLADFAEGKASANAPAGTRQLRVRVTAAQGSELSIRPDNGHGGEQVQFPDIGVNRGKETTEELSTTENTDH
jgi:hypothetical protein